jgi:hypothetical protein
MPGSMEGDPNPLEAALDLLPVRGAGSALATSASILMSGAVGCDPRLRGPRRCAKLLKPDAVHPPPPVSAHVIASKVARHAHSVDTLISGAVRAAARFPSSITGIVCNSRPLSVVPAPAELR